MATHEKKTPDWLVERLALGELDAAAAADVRRRLEAEGRNVEAELAAIAISNRQILAALPPATVAATVRRRAEAPRSSRRAAWLVALPLLGAAAAVMLVARPTQNTTPDVGGDVVDEGGLRPKGITPELNIYRRVGQSTELLRRGARVSRGDLLRLSYRKNDGGPFGAVLSIDGRGQVTVHWPAGGATSAAKLSPDGEVGLPSSYELDDAPAFERFFFVTSPTPFSMSTVTEAARALAARPEAARTQALALPAATFTQKSVMLDKTSKETP
jgi:hypothetical protein